MSDSRSSPRSIRRIVLIAFGAAFLGSIVLAVHALVIDAPPAQSADPGGLPRRLGVMFALNILGYSCFALWVRSICSGLQEWEDRLHAGLPASEVPVEVRRRVLSLVLRLTKASVYTWLFVAVANLATGILGLNDWHATLKGTLAIITAGGVVTPALLYFAADLAWRPVIPTFFPDGRLNDVPGTRQRLVVSLLMAFLLAGVWLPGLLVTASLNHTLPMIGERYTVDKFQNLLLGDMLLFFLCVITSLALTILVTRRITGPITALREAMARVERHDLDVTVPVTAADELGYLSERFNQMAAGLRERDHIRRMFGQYVTNQVADAVLRGKIKVGGQRSEVTVLMTDLRDFTALCESMEPEELVRLLNRYFDAMIDAVMEFGGTLDKFVGDAIVTVFNAPLSQDDHPLRAVRTAMRMRERLVAFNAEQQRSGHPTLRMGIGIHTGEAVVGNVGSEGKRVEYTAMGDTVNVAARLESLTKVVGADICISAETYSRVRDRVCVEAPFSTRVKGRKAPVTVHSLTDMRTAEVRIAAAPESAVESDEASIRTLRLPALHRRFLPQ